LLAEKYILEAVAQVAGMKVDFFTTSLPAIIE